MKTKIATLIFVISCFGINTKAQTDSENPELQRDVEVVNTYLPTIPNPQKIHRLPEIDDTMSYKPVFKYSILNKITRIKTDPDSIEVASMNFPKERTIYKSLVKAGAGSAFSEAEYFYNIGFSETYHLSLNLGHHSSYGKVELDNSEKVKAPVNNTWANVDFGYFFGNSSLKTQLSFDNDIYQFYGFQDIAKTDNYVLNGGTETLLGDELIDTKQRMTDFDFFVSIENNKVNPREKTNYKAGLGFDIFSNKTGVRELNFDVLGKVRFPFHENYLGGIDAVVNIANTSVPENDALYTFTERKHADIQVSPHLGLDFDYAKVRFGIKLIAEIEDEEDDIFLQPDISGELHIAEGIVSLFANISGGYKANTYKQIMKENPFVSPDLNLHSSNEPFVLSGGLRARFSDKVSFSAMVTYGTYEDEYFWMNRSVYNTTLGDSAYINRFTAVVDDGKLFKAHAELNITPNNRTQILLTGTYFDWDNNYVTAWNKPQYELGLDARFYMTRKLLVNADVNMVGEREMYVPTVGKVDLDFVYDVNLEAEYLINSRWTAFVRLNNIAACKYAMLYGYNVHSINVLGGITYKF